MFDITTEHVTFTLLYEIVWMPRVAVSATPAESRHVRISADCDNERDLEDTWRAATRVCSESCGKVPVGDSTRAVPEWFVLLPQEGNRTFFKGAVMWEGTTWDIGRHIGEQAALASLPYNKLANYLPTAQLSSYSLVLPEKLTVSQLAKKLRAFETRCFITAFTKAHHLTLFRARWIQSAPSRRISVKLHFHPRLGLPRDSCVQDAPTKTVPLAAWHANYIRCAGLSKSGR